MSKKELVIWERTREESIANQDEKLAELPTPKAIWTKIYVIGNQTQRMYKSIISHIEPSIYQNPVSSIQHPVSRNQYPASSIQKPASSIQYPVSRNQHPVSRNQHPASSNQHPASSN